MSKEFLVAPSLLSADFSCLGEEIKAVESAGADWLHVDVMDGHFVPNLTIGVPVVKSIKKVAQCPLDVHLMIENPEKFVGAFCDAGADYLTIHVEATQTPKDLIQSIRERGARPGITMRPQTPWEQLRPCLELVDLVLVMTVNPGFGGQTFMADQVQKIEGLAKYRQEKGLDYLIEVDGGINEQTARQCRAADVLVAGSYVFSNTYKDAIQSLKKAKQE